jgi:hypothetical protein
MNEPETPEGGLPGDEVAILEFERTHWGSPPNKESAVRERFGLSLARYYQRLYAVCEKPEALAYDAVLIRACVEASTMRSHQRRLGKEVSDG